MTRWFWLARTAAFAGVMLCMSWLAGATWCQSRDGQVPSAVPPVVPASGTLPDVCVPNVNTWGHFPTKWRQWPGEQHPEQNNPRALGKEVIPTPQGREEVPPPKAALPQQLPPSPEGTAQPPEAGRIVPPEGLLIPRKPPEERWGNRVRPALDAAARRGIAGPAARTCATCARRQAVAQPFAESVAESFVESSSNPSPSPSPSPSSSPTPGTATPSAPASEDAHKPAADLKSQGTPLLRPVPLICDIEPERNCFPSNRRPT